MHSTKRWHCTLWPFPSLVHTTPFLTHCITFHLFVTGEKETSNLVHSVYHSKSQPADNPSLKGAWAGGPFNFWEPQSYLCVAKVRAVRFSAGKLPLWLDGWEDNLSGVVVIVNTAVGLDPSMALEWPVNMIWDSAANSSSKPLLYAMLTILVNTPEFHGTIWYEMLF